MHARIIITAALLPLILSPSTRAHPAPFDSPLHQPAPQSRPNVLLITLDTVRADRMGFLGSTRGLTPALDAFARQSIVYTRAFAQAPITTVSHATILTGTYPAAHGVRDFGAALSGAAPYLPAILQRAGYRTGAFVGSLILDPRAGTAPGFDRGFDVYDAGFQLKQPGIGRYASVERRGDVVASRALRWIASSREPRAPSPWFAWVHLFDAHDPYDPPADLKRRFAAAPYDGEIAAVDRAAGALITAAGPGALVVVTADHGEALGDHGEETHGVFLYDATLHVPLVVGLPAGGAAGGRVAGRVRLVDVAPTILAALGLRPEPGMQGQSLLQIKTGEDRPAYAETEYPRRAFGWSALASWRDEQFLFIRAPRRELYDLAADPAAGHNLADARTRVADGIESALRRFVEGSGQRDAPPRIDPETSKRLAALGYVGGGAGTPRSTGADPKDRIAIANTLHRAIVAVEDGAFDRAAPLLEQVVASEPTIQIAQLNLGIVRVRQRKHAQALAPLRAAIALQPDAMNAHYELAVALYETGDLQMAAKHFEIVAARMPQWADARYSYASVLARIDRVGHAVAELRAALALEPRHFRANLLLGRISTLQARPADAIPYLETAVAVQPSSAEAHSFLADAYDKAGRSADAVAERRRAAELSPKR